MKRKPTEQAIDLHRRIVERQQTLREGITHYASAIARNPFDSISHPSFVATLIDYTAELYVIDVITAHAPDYEPQTVANVMASLKNVQDQIEPNQYSPDAVRLHKGILNWIRVWQGRATKLLTVPTE